MSPTRLVASSTIRAHVVGQHVDAVGQPPELGLELVEPGQRRRRVGRQPAGRAAPHQLVAELLDLAVEQRQLGLDVGERLLLRRRQGKATAADRRDRLRESARIGRLLADQAPGPPVTTVTARRFCAKQLSSGQVATGRSRP